MGAHVIKMGLSRFIIDLMERGLVTLVGMNGAGPIHDYELSLIGATTESVARYITEGQFGLWQETGRINEIVAQGAADGLGYGEALGREIAEGDYPHKEISVLAAGYRLRHPRHRPHRHRAGHHPRAPELRRAPRSAPRRIATS